MNGSSKLNGGLGRNLSDYGGMTGFGGGSSVFGEGGFGRGGGRFNDFHDFGTQILIKISKTSMVNPVKSQNPKTNNNQNKANNKNRPKNKN